MTTFVRDTRPPSWAVYDAIQSVIEGVDEVARQNEARWGVGRLDLLVADDLRERFRKQQRRLDDAISQHDLGAVSRAGEAMKRAWSALDQAARAAGHPELQPNVWEVAMPDGRIVAFVQSNAEAAILTRSARYLDVWTAEEVALVIAKFPEIALAKQTFPGATVKSARMKPRPIDWAVGDEIPF
jgi:hypothetical protein